MQEPGRLQAVIDILTEIHDTPQAADRYLEKWARGNRYAGSKDRRAISEAVYQVLRNRRFLSHAVSDDSPRLVALASYHLLHGHSIEDISAMADGGKFGPAVLQDEERNALIASSAVVSTVASSTDDSQKAIRFSVPEWAEADMRAALGDTFDANAEMLLERAPLDIRVNTLKASSEQVQATLAEEEILVSPVEGIATALRVTQGRNIMQTELYKDGSIEVQDAGAQLTSLLCHVKRGMTVLDYCAGAGGKALAMAAQMEHHGRVFVHDDDRRRLKPLWERAKRAGTELIELARDLPELENSLDLVVVDVPCSGSGRWRRNPETKWQMDPKALEDLCALQAKILKQALKYVRPGGRLVYITCSILDCENKAQADKFVAENEGFAYDTQGAGLEHGFRQLSPAGNATDGLFIASFQRLT